MTYVIHNELRPGRYAGESRKTEWVSHSEAARWRTLDGARKAAARLSPFYLVTVHEDVHGGIVGHSRPVGRDE